MANENTGTRSAAIRTTRQTSSSFFPRSTVFLVLWTMTISTVMILPTSSLPVLSLIPVTQYAASITEGRSVCVGCKRSCQSLFSYRACRFVTTLSSNKSQRAATPRLSPLVRFATASPQNGDQKGGRSGVTLGVSRRTLLSLVAATLVVLPAAAEVYSRLGKTAFPDGNFPTPTAGTWNDVRHVTLVFHGAGGQDAYTDQLMSKLDGLYGKKKEFYASMMEWSDFSTNILQASFNGERIGCEAAVRLQQRAPNLKTVHLIGISVGSFAANAASLQLKQQGTNKETSLPYVQTTFLAPFTQRGIWGIGYGIREFGKSADYAQQYFNTDDPVPSTHSPLENAVCFNVTSIRPTETFGHGWPLQYYSRASPFSLGIVPRGKQLPRGTVRQVTQ
jgi:hypothetical protein